jgi:acyl carrier protein
MSIIAQHIAEIMIKKLEVPAEKVGLQTEFDAMELDSLVLVQLAVILEKRYGTSVEDWEIAAAKTIENTATMLESKGVLV